MEFPLLHRLVKFVVDDLFLSVDGFRLFVVRKKLSGKKYEVCLVGDYPKVCQVRKKDAEASARFRLEEMDEGQMLVVYFWRGSDAPEGLHPEVPAGNFVE